MAAAVRREAPDQILHLGDVSRDAADLKRQFPDIPLACVCGNCDGRSDLPEQRILTFEGRRVLMCHGHTYGVKAGIGGAVAAAREAGVDALLFGHTHSACCDLLGELWVMNPGSIGSLYAASYGVMRMSGDGMVCYTQGDGGGAERCCW